MARFGYTLMTEQSGPKELVRYAVSAENVGFDFEVSSDHYFPWLASQGHAPNAWTMLGAVAHATDRVELFTYVTCPIMRYSGDPGADRCRGVGAEVGRDLRPTR
jgi:G6PDH family F420-dependent oxidoreductase